MTQKNGHILNSEQTMTCSNLNIINTENGGQKTETHEESLKVEHLEINITPNNPQNSTSLMEHAEDPKIDIDSKDEEETEEPTNNDNAFQTILYTFLLYLNGEIDFNINQLFILRSIITVLIDQQIAGEESDEENDSTDNSSNHEVKMKKNQHKHTLKMTICL